MFEEELLDRFRQKALLAAPSMRFAPDLVNEAVAVLVHTLGVDWIEKKAEERSRALPLPILKHPVGGMIHTGGEVQVAEVLELSEYLKMVASSTAFPLIVAGLRAQFRPTLLQLAFSYRIEQITSAAPILEPPVSGGRLGDIGFSLGGQSYFAECYAPGTRARKLDELQWLTSKVMADVQERENTYSVAIQFRTIPDAEERKALERLIVRLVGDLDPVDWNGRGYPPSVLEQNEIALVSVSRTLVSQPGQRALLALHPDFPELGEPQQFIAVKQVPISRVKALQSDTLGDPYRDHIAIWLPDENAGLPDVVDKQVLALLPKLRAKLSQTKAPGAHRLLIVDTWTAGARYTFSEAARAEVERTLFDNHSDVAGVLMVTRRYSESNKRYRYEMRACINESVGGQPISRLIEAEPQLLVPAVSV